MAAETRAVAIPLKRGKRQPQLFAWVDAEDAERVRRHEWRAHRKGRVIYAIATSTYGLGRSDVSLHNFVMRKLSGQIFDHVNGDGLDCTKANLRPATNQQNAFNSRKTVSGVPSSIFKGVYKAGPSKWRACIKKDAKNRSLGTFSNEEDAVRAYDSAATSVFGEFARTNEAMGLFDRKAA